MLPIDSRSPDRRLLLLPYLALVVLHLISGLQMEQPLILADELGYLGNARYLAGAAPLPNMEETQLYHFGYSLFLVPAFWLFSEPLTSYKVVIVINALLASALYFPLFVLLTSNLEVRRKWAVWIALGCCLYPAVLFYSNFAWAENAFILCFASTAALYGRFLRSRSLAALSLVCVGAGFLYTIHPRALPVLVLVSAYLLALAGLGVLRRAYFLVGVATVGGVFVATRLVNEHLEGVGWSGSGDFSVVKVGQRLITSGKLETLADRALGQLLYLSQATHGLFLVGLILLAWVGMRAIRERSVRRSLVTPRTGVPIFVGIMAAGVFLASFTFKLYPFGPGGIQAADFIHGRYNEATAVLFSAIALAALSRRRRLSKRRLVGLALAVSTGILILTVPVMREISTARERFGPELEWTLDASNVVSVFPLLDRIETMNLYPVSVFTIASFCLIHLAMWRRPPLGIAVVTLLFAGFAVDNFRRDVLPAMAKARPRLSFLEQLSHLEPLEALSYDVAYFDPGLLYGLQYLLPHTTFDRFHSRQSSLPQSEVVISANQWPRARSFQADYVVAVGDGYRALWVLPGEVRDRLPNTSYTGVTLGAEPAFRVRELGFYRTQWQDGRPVRWTDGAAMLEVPLDASHQPDSLEVVTAATGRETARLRVAANGVELWNDSVPERWSNTFSLTDVPMERMLSIELDSDTFLPEEGSVEGARQRGLGVLVQRVQLGSTAALAAVFSNGRAFGAEPVFGIEESGFHVPERVYDLPARWTDGRASLKVPIERSRPPQWLEIETIAPGREAVRLEIYANGVEIGRETAPPDVWSKRFDLAEISMADVLVIELRSDTFTPAERIEGSSDERSLGVMVRSLRLGR